MARIAFDLDGTLIDSAPDIRAAMNSVLESRGVTPLSLEETRSFIGSGAPVFVERMGAARGIDAAALPEFLNGFLAGYESAVDLTELYDGVRAALTRLREAGHRLAICTNKPIAPARAILAHLDLAQYFDCVIGGDSLPVRKPDPAPLWAALEGLGEGPALYVGDSDIDAATALAAGVPFLLYMQGYLHVPAESLTYVARFSQFEDLPRLVGQALV